MTAPGWTGRQLPLVVGSVAHGGHCVARFEGRVVFVRHALPGEHVLARVTEDRGGSYCRADAVEIVQAAPDRVEPPCPLARPGRCGGCDWQHASGPAQRDLKASVVREQLARLGGHPDVAVAVEEVPGGLLGWRTRMHFAVTGDGIVGLHRHRSTEIEPVASCPISAPAVDAVGVTRARWQGAATVEVVASTAGDRAVVVTPRPGAEVAVPPLEADSVAVLRRRSPAARAERVRGHRAVRERVLGATVRVAADSFWQVHPAAADVLAGAVVDALQPRAGESALDLYAGAGLFAVALAPHLRAGRLLAVEADPVAAGDAAFNLRDTAAEVSVQTGSVERVLRRLPAGPVDLVILDPPRAGAGAKVVSLVADRAPRAVAYVACDPAALARDVKTFADHGYRLERIRAFDLFPMTHHVECVALLQPLLAPA